MISPSLGSYANRLRAWEKLLHQALPVVLEGVEFLHVRGDQRVEGRETVSDLFLFSQRRKWDLHLFQVSRAKVLYSTTNCSRCGLSLKVRAPNESLEIAKMKPLTSRPKTNKSSVENSTSGCVCDNR